MALDTEGGLFLPASLPLFHLSIQPISLASGVTDRSQAWLLGIPRPGRPCVVGGGADVCVFNVTGLPFGSWGRR